MEMIAAMYCETGRAEDVLFVRRAPLPEAGPGEVRVRISWSGVNPSDVKLRAGLRSKTPAFPLVIPHSDGSGVIDQIGAGVDESRLGQRVWIWNAAWRRAQGTAAQWVSLPEQQAVPLPENVELEFGACLGIPALTAAHSTLCAGGVRGKRVLVAGGAGCVGYYAVQLAKIAGARQVIASVSAESKARVAHDAGADAIVNYVEDDLVGAVLAHTRGEGVDRIIDVDLAGNVERDLELLKEGGEIVVYGSGQELVLLPFFCAAQKSVNLHFFLVYQLSRNDRNAAMSLIAEQLSSGTLKHRIAARFPLDRIAEAHATVESGAAIGNVLVSPVL